MQVQKKVINTFPTEIENIIYRNLIELNFSDVQQEFSKYDWAFHRLKLSIQSYAFNGLLYVEQLENGIIGQIVTIMSHNREEIETIGFTKRRYVKLHMNAMEHWHKYVTTNQTIKDWTDDDYNKNYGIWREDIGNGMLRIKVMIDSFPFGVNWGSDFDEFNTMNPQELFWTKFPGFLPIEIIIHSKYVTKSIIKLDQYQIPVKYNFEEDVLFVSEKVKQIALSKCQIEKQNILIIIMEFFIVKPTILIHSPKFRETIFKKMDELIENIDYSTINKQFDENTIKIIDVVERMNKVIGEIVIDPLYTV